MIFPQKPVIWVDPRDIKLHAMPPGGYFARNMYRHNPVDRLTTAPLVALWRKAHLVYGGHWDQKTEPVAQLLQFICMNDLVRHEDDFRASNWYQMACKDIDRKGFFRHKMRRAATIAELDTLFESDLLALLKSMRAQGYQPRPGDWPLGVIDRQGRVLKSEKGRHRFAAACAVALARFPLQITAVHRLWAGSDRGAALTGRIMELGQEGP